MPGCAPADSSRLANAAMSPNFALPRSQVPSSSPVGSNPSSMTLHGRFGPDGESAAMTFVVSTSVSGWLSPYEVVPVVGPEHRNLRQERRVAQMPTERPAWPRTETRRRNRPVTERRTPTAPGSRAERPPPPFRTSAQRLRPVRSAFQKQNADGRGGDAVAVGTHAIPTSSRTTAACGWALRLATRGPHRTAPSGHRGRGARPRDRRANEGAA